ncbi:MAG: DNA-binding protein [Acidimicrobiales bacterium]|nr:DNA-binding protein [Acidimicrobiales bacterium]
MVEPSRSAVLLRDVRRCTGLSQRAFAELGGTSGPTIAAYELATKEPRLSTIERLAEAAGLEVQVTLVPAEPAMAARARREQRSLAVAAAVAAAVERDPDRARAIAEENLAKMETVVGSNASRRWPDEWRTIVDRGPRAIRRALLQRGPHGHDMRQMSPFAGVITDGERRAALAACKVLTVEER